MPGRPVLTVVETFSKAEKGMSSTAREVIAFHHVLAQASKQVGEAVQGVAVLLSGDNQGAVRYNQSIPEQGPRSEWGASKGVRVVHGARF